MWPNFEVNDPKICELIKEILQTLFFFLIIEGNLSWVESTFMRFGFQHVPFQMYVFNLEWD